jgi:hypothetical protein
MMPRTTSNPLSRVFEIEGAAEMLLNKKESGSLKRSQRRNIPSMEKTSARSLE